MPVTTLARYGNRSLVYRGKYSRYRVASAAARYAWKHRAKAKWAARKIYSFWKKRRTKVRYASKIGASKYKGNCKKCDIQDGSQVTPSSRLLVFHEITAIQKDDNGVGGPKIDRRERNAINISGFKVRMAFRNQINDPVCVNIAVLAAKRSKTIADDGFFRAYTGSRDVNFSTGLNSMLMNNLPISSDKYWVMARRKFTVGPSGDGGNAYSQHRNNTKYFEKYWKIKRQVTFNDDSGSECENPLFLVYWYDKFEAPGGEAATANGAVIQLHITTYFRELPNQIC